MICTIPVGGGAETRLTDGFEHADGRDITPDGRWIWFPHPSPEGRHVVYLSYTPGTQGHPRDREVDLRLMPAAGSPARILLDVFGGHGTMNVPNWSPDGACFAFVRYARY